MRTLNANFIFYCQKCQMINIIHFCGHCLLYNKNKITVMLKPGCVMRPNENFYYSFLNLDLMAGGL